MSRAGNSLTPWERQVMDLWDVGRSMQQIALELECPIARVQQAVSRYAHRPNDVAWADAARHASEQLVRACRATGQSFA